jgi:hypothetical protein
MGLLLLHGSGWSEKWIFTTTHSYFIGLSFVREMRLLFGMEDVVSPVGVCALE